MPKDAPPAPPTEDGVAFTKQPAAKLPLEPGAPGDRQYRVKCGDHEAVVIAPNEHDARAKFNDARKEWPSPKHVKVEEIK